MQQGNSVTIAANFGRTETSFDFLYIDQIHEGTSVAADLAAWFSSNGLPPSRFLVVGMIYCAVGATGIAAAWVLRGNSTRGRLLASVFIALVALDVLGDVYRKRSAGFHFEDVVEKALSGILLLVTGVYLIQSRRRFEARPT